MTKKLATALAVLLNSSTLAMANDINFVTGTISGVRTIEQKGVGNDIYATLTGSLHTFTLKQTGAGNGFDIYSHGSQAVAASDSTLIVEVVGDNNYSSPSLASTGSPIMIMNSYEKIDGDRNSVANEIDASDIAVYMLTTGNDNSVTSTLAASSVELLMDITGDDNIVTQTADATTSVYLRRAITGDRNKVTYNPTSDSGLPNLADIVSNTVEVFGDDNDVTLRQRGENGLLDASFTMDDRLAVISQTGASNTADLTVTAVGSARGTSLVDYTVTQSAASSTVRDEVYLASGGYSSITITN